jgi:hypothetical protein
MSGDREESLRGEKERKQWSIPTLTVGKSSAEVS